MHKKKWIDFSRGIAVLLVIMIHEGQYHSLPNFFKRITTSGDMGVLLFFILSAITLFTSFENRYKNDGINRNKYFFIRRFFRIAPLYYFFALFYMSIEIIKTGFFNVPYWKILVNILFLNGFFPTAINYIPPGGWSVGVEMIFYTTIPYLYKFIRNWKRALILLIFAILFSNLINLIDWYLVSKYTTYNYYNIRSWFFYFWFPNQFPVFVFGILFFYIISKLIIPKHISLIFLILSVSFFILLSQFNFSLYYPYYFFQREYIYPIVFCFFLIGIKDYNFNNSFQSIFILIGRYSFCMYLLHFFIIDIYRYFIVTFNLEKSWGNNFIIIYLLVVTTTFKISKYVHKFELKGINYGNNLINKLSNKNTF